MPNDPKTYQFDLPTTDRPTDVNLPETWYPGIRDFWSACTTKRSVHPINGIRAIVIHATAGGNSAGAVSVMKAGTASFHWLVPDEDEPQHGQLVWACAPEALAAWHVRNDKSHPAVNGGKDRVNHWSLGIELVNIQAGTDAFSDWQIMITALRHHHLAAAADTSVVCRENLPPCALVYTWAPNPIPDAHCGHRAAAHCQ